jgi:TadE-like protein
MGQQPWEYVMPKITCTKFNRLKQFARQLRDDNSGLALVEFAISLPFFMGLTVGGIEVANYASVVMQLNQIAIHTADNAARIGVQSALPEKRINELQINDLFEGTLSEGDRVALSGVHGYQDPVTGVRSIRGGCPLRARHPQIPDPVAKMRRRCPAIYIQLWQ